MILSHTPGIIKRFRRTQWKFQQTFLTPLQDLPPFVATILAGIEDLRGGTVNIDQDIGFDLRHLAPLLQKHGIPSPIVDHDWSIQAADAGETQLLLHASLGDWLDFVFIPDPTPFSLYADHDEYTTFFAHSKSNLTRVVDALTQGGFAAVDFHRTL